MGRKWTKDDVLAYKIKFVQQDLKTFFGVTDLPPPDVANDALTAMDLSTVTDDWSYFMLYQMDTLTEDPNNIEPSTIDFVRELFNVLRYWSVAPKKRSVIIRQKLRYLASQGSPPQLDICVVDHTKAISLVVKVDGHLRGSDPEARLISGAIAAFHNDNLMRVKRFGTDPLTSMVMRGIVVDGTMPTFYQIPITAELVTAIESGEQPEHETIVGVYRPEVPRPEEGMKPLDNRSIIFSCYEALKQQFL
jgi:hypothetical protein